MIYLLKWGNSLEHRRKLARILKINCRGNASKIAFCFTYIPELPKNKEIEGL
jgi:hypothetical protein